MKWQAALTQLGRGQCRCVTVIFPSEPTQAAVSVFQFMVAGQPRDLLIFFFFSLGPKTAGFRNSEEFAWHK